MATGFPHTLDVFANPGPTTTFNSSPALYHDVQHVNLNDSMAAVQAQLGVTGSGVTSSFEFRLHNVSAGHNHDGVNSRPVVLGPPISGSSYLDGAFAFQATTPVGYAVDALNQFVFNMASGSLTTFEYEGDPQGVGEVTTTVNFTGTGVTASYIGNVTEYQVTRGLLPEDRALILLAESGPYEGYLGTLVHECVMHKNVFPSASIWYTDVSKTAKIIEQELVYATPSAFLPSQTIYRVYENDGSTVKATVLDVITYSGIFETSRTRTVL